MSQNPYESPTSPSQPRHRFDEQIIEQRSRKWILVSLVVAFALTPLFFMQIPTHLVRHAPMGSLGLSFGLALGIGLPIYWVAKAIYRRQSPIFPPEEDSDWLPR